MSASRANRCGGGSGSRSRSPGAIAEVDGAEIARAWFQGLNPQLGDRSPARLLREGDLDEVGPEEIGAERAFLVGG